jgi:hypothetical protein
MRSRRMSVSATSLAVVGSLVAAPILLEMLAGAFEPTATILRLTTACYSCNPLKRRAVACVSLRHQFEAYNRILPALVIKQRKSEKRI